LEKKKTSNTGTRSVGYRKGVVKKSYRCPKSYDFLPEAIFRSFDGTFLPQNGVTMESSKGGW